MTLNSMYFFSKDESYRKWLVIRIEGEKNEVAKSFVGVILGDEIPEGYSKPFEVMRVQFTSSGKSFSSSMGEVKFNMDNSLERFQKNKDSLSYVIVSGCRVLSPRKISIPGDWH